jgi:hypothetical protein
VGAQRIKQAVQEARVKSNLIRLFQQRRKDVEPLVGRFGVLVGPHNGRTDLLSEIHVGAEYGF